jgi:hypothetical protein
MVEQARRRHSLPARESSFRGAFDAHDRGGLEEFIQAQILDERTLDRGLAEGSLLLDTRLRDALRVLVGAEAAPLPATDARFALPDHDSPRLRFPRPSVVEDAAYAVEAAVLGEADAVRLQRRVDELERRLALLERSSRRRLAGTALGHRLRQLASAR